MEDDMDNLRAEFGVRGDDETCPTLSRKSPSVRPPRVVVIGTMPPSCSSGSEKASSSEEEVEEEVSS